MYTSHSRLFFGILVPALDLIIAARVWPRRKILRIVFESVIRARQQGRLVLLEHVEPVLLRVPPEIWYRIESFAAVALSDAETHKVIKSLHASGAGHDECRCAVCARDEHLTLVEHDTPILDWMCLWSCDSCNDGFVEADGSRGLMDAQAEDINRLLDAFDLALVHDRPVSSSDHPSFDICATAAIGLPVVSSTRAKAEHNGYTEWADDVERLDPALFVLPPDAQDRFRRLVRTCHVECRMPTRVRAREERAGPHEGAGTACVEESEVEPARWHLWGSVSDCT